MPIARRHLPLCLPAVAGLATLGVVLWLGASDVLGLSCGFVGCSLLVLAGIAAAALLLDMLLISHRDRHRYRGATRADTRSLD